MIIKLDSLATIKNKKVDFSSLIGKTQPIEKSAVAFLAVIDKEPNLKTFKKNSDSLLALKSFFFFPKLYAHTESEKLVS